MADEPGKDHGPRKRAHNAPFWRRRSFLVTVGVFALLLILAALGDDPERESDDRAAQGGVAGATATPTPNPLRAVREEAASLVAGKRYLAAAGVLEDAGLTRAAARARRRGTRALLASARRAIDRGRYEVAKAFALDARQLARTAAVRSVLATANAGIARERAEARERRRQAEVARDLRTCTGDEKSTVRAGGGIPAGCTDYAVELEARRAEREVELDTQQEDEASGTGCAPGYSPCIPPYPPDLDCPDVGPVTVSGSDPHGLDADNDGVACGGD